MWLCNGRHHRAALALHDLVAHCVLNGFGMHATHNRIYEAVIVHASMHPTCAKLGAAVLWGCRTVLPCAWAGCDGVLGFSCAAAVCMCTSILVDAAILAPPLELLVSSQVGNMLPWHLQLTMPRCDHPQTANYEQAGTAALPDFLTLTPRARRGQCRTDFKGSNRDLVLDDTAGGDVRDVAGEVVTQPAP